MSFRLSILNLRRASLTGLVCLAFAGALRAEDTGSQPIEIVPFHGTSMDTNFDQESASAPRTFELLSPQAPHPFQTTRPSASALPPPRPQPAPSQRDRELLDRRRNWVFMTPEEFASPAGKKDSDPKDENTGENSLTVMERYYQRLNDADRSAATNRMNRPELSRLDTQTNLFTERLRNQDAAPFGPSPFNTTPDPGVFGAVRPNGFSSGPNSGGLRSDSVGMPSPEEIRQQAEQKAHLDSFKELWNINQPPAPVQAQAPVSVPVPTPVDAAPVFGASPGVHSLFNATRSGGLSEPQQSGQPTMTSSRNSAPPRGTFTPPQRPF